MSRESVSVYVCPQCSLLTPEPDSLSNLLNHHWAARSSTHTQGYVYLYLRYLKLLLICFFSFSFHPHAYLCPCCVMSIALLAGTGEPPSVTLRTSMDFLSGLLLPWRFNMGESTRFLGGSGETARQVDSEYTQCT